MAANTDKKKVSMHPLMWTVIGLTAASFDLLLAAMLIPPQGEVHPSVLKGLSIITADIALVNFAYAIVSNKIATFRHGNTTATVGAAKKQKMKNDAKDN